MAISAAVSTATAAAHLSSPLRRHRTPLIFPSHTLSSLSLKLPPPKSSPRSFRIFSTAHHGGGIGGGGSNGGGGGGGGGGKGGEGYNDDGNAGEKNRGEAILVLSEIGRSLDSLPKDMAAAIEAGKIPRLIVHRYFELEKSLILRWLLRFGGFRERLLGDELFLAKLAMECGVGIFTKMAAELQKRGDKFSKELDFVCADVIMAFVADFMLVWLPAPTVSLRPPLAISSGPLANFFYNCPDNAFQIALAGTSYTFLQRFGAFLRNGAKLFAIGTGASMTGTVITNTLIRLRKAVDVSFAREAEDIPILATGAAYGVYMSISSNLRYQTLAGIIEQRFLEPLLHNHKILLSAMCFAFRTGNTFLGSLMWVDFARWIGVQRSRE